MSLSIVLIFLSTIMLAIFILLILLKSKNKPEGSYKLEEMVRNSSICIVIGERVKRARHSQACSIENRDIYMSFLPFDP